MQSEPFSPTGPSPTGPSPTGLGLALDGASLSFTMQATPEPMTHEQAAACSLLDMPDEPGMVRLPVTINVLLPHELLHPPERPPPADGPAHLPDAAPPRYAKARRSRFGPMF